MSRDIIQHAIESLMRAGADKAQCRGTASEKSEICVEWGDISLLRTTYDTSLSLTAFKENRKATRTLNKTGLQDIEEAAIGVVELSGSSRPDPAHDIAIAQPAARFQAGPDKPNLDMMYDRLKEFIHYQKSTFPQTNLRGINFYFTKSHRWFLNSNGVDFEEETGVYTIVAIFSSREGRNISSFNYTAYQMRDIDRPISEIGSLKTLLTQSAEQTHNSRLPGKFTGSIIVTPDCLTSFLDSLTSYLRDHAMISGTSAFKSKLHEKIADSRFSLHSRPTSDEIADNYFVTGDGFAAQDTTLIDRGILKSFLLGLYGSNKTGKERAGNDGECYIVDPGDHSLDDMIKNVDEGILLCRFSGGSPSDNGDFSGVAKNSYYIKDGAIQFPLIETMVSGNLLQMMHSIVSISQERVNFGFGIFPWITFDGVTISGK